jgi:hypothetical protein
MAVTVSKNNTTLAGNNYRAFLFRLFELFSVGGAFYDQWRVVGSSGTWTSEGSAANGDWFRVQCQTAWADATKQEVLFGYRTSNGAVAGYAGGLTGINFVAAPKGNWNAGTLVYDSVNTGIMVLVVNASPTTFHAWADDENFLILSDNLGAGNWIANNSIGIFCGKLTACDSLAKPWACLLSNAGPQVDVTNTGFSHTTITSMKALRTDEVACEFCHVISSTHTDNAQIYSAKDGLYRGFPLLQVKERVVSGATVGDLPSWIRRINKNIAGTGVAVINGSANVCVGGLVLPW